MKGGKQVSSVEDPYEEKDVSPYLRKTPEQVRQSILRAREAFEKSGCKTLDEYAKTLKRF